MVFLVDGSFHIEFVVFVGLPHVQEEVVVGAEEVEDLVDDVEEQAVDCVLVKAVGLAETLLLPDCHLLVEQFVGSLLQVAPPHLNSIICSTAKTWRRTSHKEAYHREEWSKEA